MPRETERFDAYWCRHFATANSVLDLAAALHEIMPDLPILVATASADDIRTDTLVAAAGISEIVHRPLISAEIASALARRLKVSDDFGSRITAVTLSCGIEIMP